MAENGNHVTRAELKATVDPIKDDISEIKADVKTLVAANVAAQAIQAAQGQIKLEGKDRGARRIALVGVAAAVFSGSWWVPDALAKAFH